MTETALAPAEAEAFRAKCREFLEAHTASGGVSTLDDGRKFLAAAAEAGLAGITYPSEYGGAGLTAAHDKIWREERSAFPTMDGDDTRHQAEPPSGLYAGRARGHVRPPQPGLHARQLPVRHASHAGSCRE